MNRLPFGALLSVSLAFGLTEGPVFAQESKFDEARAHIEKWVQTRQLIARRGADWRVERESIGQSIGLLQREIDKSEQVDSEADAEGWDWTANAGLGPAIRKVIDIYENERSAEFVPVPVNIQ